MRSAERNHYEKVVELGCIACRKLGHYDSPAEIHHIRSGYGISQRAPYDKTIPLCPWHHRVGGYGESYHAGPKIWQEKFGDEEDLVKEVNALIYGI